jgi:peroxin-19
MLDEFTPSKHEPTAPSGPGRPQEPIPSSIPEGVSDDDFAKQLQAGMSELLGELDTSPDMQAQFESLLKELGGPAALGDLAASAAAGAAAATGPSTSGLKDAAPTAAQSKEEESFQATIEKTMERMRLSGDNATAAAASTDTDDILAQMMKAMQDGGLDGEGGEEDFSKMILGMMEQLTNKEILYEPMKELDDKFPEWLEKNGSKCGADDLKRYKEQQVFVREIVGKFEEKGYKDENAKDREYIVERMQKVRFHILSKRGNMLMGDRCKRLVLRHQILLVIWRQLRKHLGRLKKGVHSNEEALSLFLDRVT